MKNREIADLLNEIADILELKGENVFRVNAYRRGAQNIDGLSRPIEDIAGEGALLELPGIGKDLAAKIAEYLETGEIDYLNELRKETPQVLLDMLRIPGIGPKTAVRLQAELGIGSLEELKHAALEHRIQELPKMKAKTEENILKGLEFLSRASEFVYVSERFAMGYNVGLGIRSASGVWTTGPKESWITFRAETGIRHLSDTDRGSIAAARNRKPRMGSDQETLISRCILLQASRLRHRSYVLESKKIAVDTLSKKS